MAPWAILYATVIERNIFGLNPPQPITTNPQDANPPAKITPNGIMDILGELQVLFLCGAAACFGFWRCLTPGILSEGQRQDDIEVVKIDQKNSVVTFNNHGENADAAARDDHARFHTGDRSGGTGRTGRTGRGLVQPGLCQPRRRTGRAPPQRWRWIRWSRRERQQWR